MGTGRATARRAERERVTPTTAALQRRMQLALGALRGVTLVWSAVVTAVDASSGVLDRPAAAAVLLAVLAVWSAVWTAAVAGRQRWVDGAASVTLDVALAAAAVAADHWLYVGDHPQSFASAWPLVAVVATAVARGPITGLIAGTVTGLANVVGALTIGTGMEGEWLSTLGTLVLLAASGWVAGWVADRLRTTAQAAADAQARDEVAATLHDGVLQTLAVIQRRSDDTDLVALAREQDQALRAFLRGGTPTGAASPPSPPLAPSTLPATSALPAPSATSATGADGDLIDRLRGEIARIERTHAIDAPLVVIDPGTSTGSAATALIGAAAEAVVNAAKHSGTDRVWVSVDRRSPSGTMVVVHDEGDGFDPATTPEGTGITSSIRRRLDAVGGGATVSSAVGRGTDVTVWAP
ncbi:MAG: ATP-binding protein [Microthrixaceae bacterium]